MSSNHAADEPPSRRRNASSSDRPAFRSLTRPGMTPGPDSSRRVTTMKAMSRAGPSVSKPGSSPSISRIQRGERPPRIEARALGRRIESMRDPGTSVAAMASATPSTSHTGSPRRVSSIATMARVMLRTSSSETSTAFGSRSASMLRARFATRSARGGAVMMNGPSSVTKTIASSASSTSCPKRPAASIRS